MIRKLLYVLQISLLISITAKAQKSQLFIARNAVGKLQASISNKEDEKKQLSIISDGIKASESAGTDRKTKNWPETWAIKSYLYSYLSLLETDGAKVDKYYNVSTEALETAKKLDKYHDNSGLIGAATYNLIIKQQDKGNESFFNNDFYAAFEQLKGVSDFFPKDTTLALNTALCAKNIQNYDEAIKYLKRAKENGAKNPAVFQNLAQIYVSKFDVESAIKTIEQGLDSNPYNTFLINDYVNLLLDNEQYTKALEVIENTVKTTKRSKLLYFLYGYLEQTTSGRNNQKAESAYRKALEMDQNYFDALYQLGLIYINNADDALKSKSANKAQEFNSSMNRAYLALLHAHEINPNDKQTIQLLIEIYTRKNRLDKVQELKKKLEEF